VFFSWTHCKINKIRILSIHSLFGSACFTTKLISHLSRCMNCTEIRNITTLRIIKNNRTHTIAHRRRYPLHTNTEHATSTLTVYVTVGCPAGRLFHVSSAAKACSGFAAERPTGRTYRSTAGASFLQTREYIVSSLSMPYIMTLTFDRIMPSNYIKRLVQLAHKPISLPHHMAVCSMLRYLEQHRTNSGAASLPDNACTVVRRWWTKLVGNGRVRSVWCPGSSWSSNIRMSWRSVSATVEQWWGRHDVGRRVNSTQWRPVVDFEQRSRICVLFFSN